MTAIRYNRKSIFWVEGPGLLNSRGLQARLIRSTSYQLKKLLQPLIDKDPEFLGRLRITDNSNRPVTWETLQGINQEGRTYGSTKGYQ